MEEADTDPEAFCRRHWRPLAQSLAAYTGDVALGQDLAQETLARVLARWPRVGRMRSPGGYAYRVGVNLARDALRDRARERRPPTPSSALPPDVTTRTDGLAWLPGGRLLQIAGEEGLAETLDHEIGTLQQWMGAVRSLLGT